jgi:carboxypeptidase T
MKTRALVTAVCLVLTVFLAPVQARQKINDDATLRVRIETTDPRALKDALEMRGYDVLWADAAHTAVDVIVSSAGWRDLQKEGFSGVAVDRGHPLQPKNAVGVKTAGASLAVAAGAVTAAAALPATYQDLEGILARMNEIASTYPAIAEVVDLTATYNTPPTAEGRHMYALKISDNVSVDEDEPAMLIVADHHAREISTPLIALEAADRLTTGYDTDPQITAAVNENEIWIAPVWNPDGYNYVFTGDNFWRKNRHVFPSGVGVDMNRNYAPGWSAPCSGSSSVTSDVYRGPAPSSEAETITMQAWSRAERFAKVIDYHSYGREVLYSYKCLTHPFTAWMRSEAVAISVASGYGGLTRVPTDEGEHQQWQFGRMGAYAFLIETETEFQPPYDSAVAEAKMVWPGVLSVLERPISVHGHVTDAATGEPLVATIDLLNVTFTNGETNASGGLYGAYHMFLPPGTYDVRFTEARHAPVVSRVTVTADSSELQEIQMAAQEVVFADDFETSRGWTRNPGGTDTATTGLWERGDPQATSSNGAKQLSTTVSGVNDLSTGRLAGTTAFSNDVDGGRTSIQSPEIVLPADGNLTLTFSYYFAHDAQSSSADYLRVTILGATKALVLQELGTAANDNAAWRSATVDLSAFAGQTVRILVETADAGVGGLVEAAMDDVRIVRKPAVQ